MSRSMLGPAILSAAILMITGCTAGASSAPSAVPSDPPPATPIPSLIAEPSVADATDAPAPEPPLAELVIDDARYPATIGGYTWDGYSQSAPWLPATGLSPVDAPAAAALSVELAGGQSGVASWTARVAVS